MCVLGLLLQHRMESYLSMCWRNFKKPVNVNRPTQKAVEVWKAFDTSLDTAVVVCTTQPSGRSSLKVSLSGTNLLSVCGVRFLDRGGDNVHPIELVPEWSGVVTFSLDIEPYQSEEGCSHLTKHGVAHLGFVNRYHRKLDSYFEPLAQPVLWVPDMT